MGARELSRVGGAAMMLCQEFLPIPSIQHRSSWIDGRIVRATLFSIVLAAPVDGDEISDSLTRRVELPVRSFRFATGVSSHLRAFMHFSFGPDSLLIDLTSPNFERRIHELRLALKGDPSNGQLHLD